MPVKKNGYDRLWSGRTLGSRAGHYAFLSLSKILPRTWAGIFLIPVSFFYYFFMPQSHAGSKQFFRNLFPGIPGWKIYIAGYRRVFAFANMLLDKAYLHIRGTGGFTIDFPDTHRVSDALKLEKGVIILSAHIGSWEVVSRFFKRFHRPVSVVAFEAERPEIRRLFKLHSQEGTLPFTVIYSNDPLNALIQVKNALGRNEVVVMHGDRVAGKGTHCNFLGTPALFPTFPFSIAAKTGTPIVCAFGVRLGSLSYRAVAFSHFALKQNPSESILPGLKQYTANLETMLRLYPFQWYNFYPFWDSTDGS